MYICMYMCIYTYTHIHLYIYRYIHIYIYAYLVQIYDCIHRLHACTYIYMYYVDACKYEGMYARRYACRYVCMHAMCAYILHICVHTYIYIYTYTHMQQPTKFSYARTGRRTHAGCSQLGQLGALHLCIPRRSSMLTCSP